MKIPMRLLAALGIAALPVAAVVYGCAEKTIDPLEARQSLATDGGSDAASLFTEAQCIYASDFGCVSGPCSFKDVDALPVQCTNEDNVYYDVDGTFFGTSVSSANREAVTSITTSPFANFHECLEPFDASNNASYFSANSNTSFMATGLTVGEAGALPSVCNGQALPYDTSEPHLSDDLCYFAQTGTKNCVVAPCRIMNVATAPPTCVGAGGFDDYAIGISGNGMYGANSVDHGELAGQIVDLYSMWPSSFRACATGAPDGGGTIEQAPAGYTAVGLAVADASPADFATMCGDSYREFDGGPVDYFTGMN